MKQARDIATRPYDEKNLNGGLLLNAIVACFVRHRNNMSVA